MKLDRTGRKEENKYDKLIGNRGIGMLLAIRALHIKQRAATCGKSPHQPVQRKETNK